MQCNLYVVPGIPKPSLCLYSHPPPHGPSPWVWYCIHMWVEEPGMGRKKKESCSGTVAMNSLNTLTDSSHVAGAEWAVATGFFEAGHPYFNYFIQWSAMTWLASIPDLSRQPRLNQRVLSTPHLQGKLKFQLNSNYIWVGISNCQVWRFKSKIKWEQKKWEEKIKKGREMQNARVLI